MPRYKLTVAYDGTNFCGWQKQEPPLPGVAVVSDGAGADEGDGPGAVGAVGAEDAAAAMSAVTAVGDEGKKAAVPAAFGEHTPQIESVRPGRAALRTVQGVLEQAVRYVVREDVIVTGASRTDSGVHAIGQVAAFTTSPRVGPDGQVVPHSAGMGWPVERGTERLVMAINSRLPEDVRVMAAEVVADGFEPIGDVTSKGYRYSIVRCMHRPLFDRFYVYHVQRPQPLDVEAMRAAAGVLVGEHDFAGFAAAGHGRMTTVRRVLSCTVVSREIVAADGLVAGGVPAGDVAAVGSAAGMGGVGERIDIDISGTGFLWNMVRIIAGTLVDVGLHRRSVEDVRTVLATGDRRKAGPTLGPQGLCLRWISYEPRG